VDYGQVFIQFLVVAKNKGDRSHVLRCHLPAFFRAIAACFCALAAMVSIVFFTFFCTGFADIGTGTAERSGIFATDAHQVHCR
jgi:hypothetical protein